MAVKKKAKVEVKAEFKPVIPPAPPKPKSNDDPLTGGLILISIGLILLITNYYGWSSLWPLVFLIPVCAICIAYFRDPKRDKSVIIPLTILSVIMLLFLSMTLGILAWSDMSWLWPVFIAAPGLGLLFYYLSTGMKDSGLLIPISILLGLALIFMTGIGTYWPLILIIVGVIILLRTKKD